MFSIKRDGTNPELIPGLVVLIPGLVVLIPGLVVLIPGLMVLIPGLMKSIPGLMKLDTTNLEQRSTLMKLDATNLERCTRLMKPDRSIAMVIEGAEDLPLQGYPISINYCDRNPQSIAEIPVGASPCGCPAIPFSKMQEIL